jgi:hypothetical protein
MFRVSSSQRFSMQIGAGQQNQAFSEIVTKEPQYAAQHPFRGVAKLGSQEFAFVLDSKSPETEPEDEPEPEEAETESIRRRLNLARRQAVGYSRLYFDLNHNGDLTDDGVIEAESESQFSSGTYVRNHFPRVDLTIDADGTKLEYGFFLYVYSRVSTSYSYAAASLSPAVYREGEITLGGKTRRVVLLDFNCNGRFGDPFTVPDEVSRSDGKIYPVYGDMLLVDPDPTPGGYRSPYDPTTSADQHYVSKLLGFDGHFYSLEIASAGDTLTLTPSTVPVGKVTNANDGFRAVVYGDQGLVKISGGGSEPVALPAGDWKLLAYTIDQTGREPAAEEDEEEEEEEQASLLKVLADAMFAPSSSSQISRPRFTLVSARGTKDGPTVEVREGQTVAMPFGPPYRPLVQVGYRQGQDQVSLGLSIVGAAGEICTDIKVDGQRPQAPEFTIVDPEGETVAVDKFKYG